MPLSSFLWSRRTSVVILSIESSHHLQQQRHPLDNVLLPFRLGDSLISWSSNPEIIYSCLNTQKLSSGKLWWEDSWLGSFSDEESCCSSSCTAPPWILIIFYLLRLAIEMAGLLSGTSSTSSFSSFSTSSRKASLSFSCIFLVSSQLFCRAWLLSSTLYLRLSRYSMRTLFLRIWKSLLRRRNCREELLCLGRGEWSIISPRSLAQSKRVLEAAADRLQVFVELRDFELGVQLCPALGRQHTWLLLRQGVLHVVHDVRPQFQQELLERPLRFAVIPDFVAVVLDYLVEEVEVQVLLVLFELLYQGVVLVFLLSKAVPLGRTRSWGQLHRQRCSEFSYMQLESLDFQEDVVVDLEEGQFVLRVYEEETKDVVVVVSVLCLFQQDQNVPLYFQNSVDVTVLLALECLQEVLEFVLVLHARQLQQLDIMVAGTLLVELFSAYLTRDTELLGKMDPFVHWSLNQSTQTVQRSTTKDDAGKMPEFNEHFVFRCQLGDTLHFSVYDEETKGKDDLVGAGSWVITDKKHKDSMTLALQYKKENVGDIKVSVQFLEDGLPTPNSQQQKLKEEQKKARQERQKEESRRQIELQKKEEKAKKKNDKKAQEQGKETFSQQEQLQNLHSKQDQIIEKTKEIIQDTQKMMLSKENAALQMEIIEQNQEYQRHKMELMEAKQRELQSGEFKGVLSLDQMQVSLKSLMQVNESSRLQIHVGTNKQGVEGEPVSTPKVALQNRQTAHWPDTLRLLVTSGQVVNLQLFDAAKEEMVAFGALSLASLKAPIAKQEVPLWRVDRQVGHLQVVVGYQDQLS